MLTYELTKAPGMPLYESLYRCIRKGAPVFSFCPVLFRLRFMREVVYNISDIQDRSCYDERYF